MKYNKKIFVPSAIALGCIVVLIAGIIIGIKNKVLDVAFYNLPETIVDPLKLQISGSYDGKINFTVLDNQSLKMSKIRKRYDLFFSWDGNVVNTLKKNSYEFKDDCFENIVPTLCADKKKLPVILDHYEIAYYLNATKEKINYPQNLAEYESYLSYLKSYVFTPFFCSGNDDAVLLAYISVIAESIGGEQGYSKLVELINSSSNIEEMIDTKIPAGAKYEFSLGSILDMLRQWASNEYIHPMWYVATEKDAEMFITDNQVGIYFTSLSKHRQMDPRIMERFSADRMPVVSLDEIHGVIAPQVVAINFSKKKRFIPVIKSLVSGKVQQNLSTQTKLGPVASQAYSCDKQADDVRYVAASCPKGALPDIENACFQNNREKEELFTTKIRFYLKSGALN